MRCNFYDGWMGQYCFALPPMIFKVQIEKEKNRDNTKVELNMNIHTLFPVFVNKKVSSSATGTITNRERVSVYGSFC